MLTTIPFCGFYESIHDSELDVTLERMFDNRDDGSNDYPELVGRVYDACDWRKVYEAYARAYCENFAAQFAIKSLRFDELNSPREYNFTTDRIFARISRADVRALWKRVDRERFTKLCEETFSSRDGFSSFYSPDWRAWGRVDGWDHNQIGALLQCIADVDAPSSESRYERFDQWAEYSLMEDARCNGELDRFIEQAVPNIGRFYRVHYWLEARRLSAEGRSREAAEMREFARIQSTND